MRKTTNVASAIFGRITKPENEAKGKRATTFVIRKLGERYLYCEHKRKVQYCYCNIAKINNLIVHKKLFYILGATIFLMFNSDFTVKETTK